MLTPPMTLQARKLGMTLLLDASKLNIPYSSLFLRVAPALLDEESGGPGQLHQGNDRRRARFTSRIKNSP